MSVATDKKPRAAKRSEGVGVIERLVTQGPPEPKQMQRTPVTVEVRQLVRHPDNRVPLPASIDAVAKSFQSEGQLEKLLVRCVRKPDEYQSFATYQIISGETRWLAARKLGWERLDAEEVDLDDAAALRVLAATNAARHDLDPIATARLIVRLCDPIDQGGSGMSREEAAKMFDLKSGGAASNLVRLLELPTAWLDRVASGKLPQTYARELLPLLLLGPDSAAWGDIEESWAAYSKDSFAWDGDCFRSREGLADEVFRLLEEFSRPIEKADGRKRSYYEQTKSYEDHGLKFKLTESLEESLRIAELPLGKGGAMIRRATNCALYDSHQIPAIKAAIAKKSKGKVAANDDELDQALAPKPGPKEQAAEGARRREEAAEKLAKRIELWRAAWLRELVAAAIVDERWEDLCVRLLVWQQHRVTQIDHRSREALHLPEQIEALYGRSVLRAKGTGEVSSVIVQWLRLEPRDGYEHPMPDEFVEDLIDLLGIDLADRWLVMQTSGQRPDRMQEFVELHNSEQLDTLGAELEVGVVGIAKKAGKVAAFVNAPKTLRLPKSLRSIRRKGGAK